jgi:hypothetical protein
LELKNLIEDSYKSNRTKEVDGDWLKNIISPKIEVNPVNNIPNELVRYIDYCIEQKGINITESVKKKAAGLKEFRKI